MTTAKAKTKTTMKTEPARGFASAEFSARAKLMQKEMARAGWDAVLFTTAADIFYFTGFLTDFFASPTRPWFVVLPARGMPVAVVPEMGKTAMAKRYVGEIRCWNSPRPEDEGVSLLAETLCGFSPQNGAVGMTLGAGTIVRMPQNDIAKLRGLLRPRTIADCSDAVLRARMRKSSAEIQKMRHIAKTTSAAFAGLPEDARGEMRERDITRRFARSLLLRGADSLAYLAAASGADGCESIIMPPGEKRLSEGDMLMIDAGAVFDGYYCDFCRNYRAGDSAKKTINARKAHGVLHYALREGFAAARPGAAAEDLWRAMESAITRKGYGASGAGVRFGHGVGLQLTEPPSLMRGDETVLKPGTVLALEPSLVMESGRAMVREENIAITKTGVEWLSDPAPEEMVSLFLR